MNDLPEPLRGEAAALIIADDQYLLRYREKEQMVLKFLAPEAVRAAFNHEPLDSGWLPEGVRRWGVTPAGHFAVLCVPAGQQDVLLTFDGPGQLVRLRVPLPPLVFMGVGTSYSLWALAGEFAPEAKLYHAPLPNIHPDGQVCWGTNVPPGAEHIARAWRLFGAAPFNADLVSGKSRAYPHDVRLKMREAVERKRRTYPLRDLVPPRATVEQAFTALLRRVT